MRQAVLVIHGAGEPRRRGAKVYWEAMLGEALGPEYHVQAPRMPQPTNPRYQIWARRIAELIDDNARPVLVGHSFGASVLLKYLAEAAPRPSFAGLFLIATPLWGPDFPEFALPPDFASRLHDASPVYLYHSRDDAEIPFEHLERYSRALPQAIVRPLDGRGHEFNQKQFPELVADIRGLRTSRPGPPEVMRLLESFAPEVRSLALQAREVLFDTVPGITEAADFRAKVIGYSQGAGYAGLIATIILSKKGVKLGIVRGAELADPKKLLGGSGKVHRFVAISAPDDLRRPGLRSLLKRAYAAWKKRLRGGR